MWKCLLTSCNQRKNNGNEREHREQPNDWHRLGKGEREQCRSCLSNFMAVFVYTLTSQLSVPSAVATQDKLSAWGIPQKVIGLPPIGNITRYQGHGQIRD